MTPLAILQHVIAWLPLVIGGILLIRAGLRGQRINDHPICRRCRFDLVGLGAPVAAATPDTALESGATKDQPTSGPDRCPECGTALTGNTRRARRAVIDGERKKRWRLFALGVVLLLSGLTTGFWLTYKPLAKFPWTTWMPDWVLAEMVDSPTRSRATAAGREIMLRLRGDRFGGSALQKAVDDILLAQADPLAIWVPVMGDVVELARAKGFVDDEAMRAYVERSYTFSAKARPRIGTYERLVWELSHVSGRAGSGLEHPRAGTHKLAIVVNHEAYAITFGDGTKHDIAHGGGWFRTMSGASGANSASVTHDLSPGEHAATIHVRLAAHESVDQETGRHFDEPLFERDLALPITFHVADATHISFVVDESKRAEMVGAFVVDRLDITPDSPDKGNSDELSFNDRVRLHLRVSGPPLAYAFNIHLQLDKREINLGAIRGAARGGETTHGLSDWRPDQEPLPKLDVAFATLRLTPDTRAAKSAVDLTEIWGEEIVIENVPITWNEN